ncbi:hypothetical protein CVT25_003963 [Psilocybe cyanescens]|uniref:26S proteasome regulatory subunit Rpn6 N-terminal domain-containing protein n=1 Tax=Psilocybe cyanescens TaxID=93625 RepID=A0A409WXY9_PSICY|nr:hypothetical protein CVT25_003963 [Psilocybe cyanescens]
MKVLMDNIACAKTKKCIFLKHSLEKLLVGLCRQLKSCQYQPALALIDTLPTELQWLDDKMILTEVHLLTSRVYCGVGNMPKAKASLTSSRTATSAIYCPPALQAQLDLQSGVLHAEEKDCSTPEDLNALLTIKLALRYATSRDVESMRAVVRVHQKQDLCAAILYKTKASPSP